VSVSVMPECAGLVPAFVNVTTTVVDAPSAMVPAPKVLATVGVTMVSVAFVVVPVSATGPVAVGAVVVLTLVEVAVTSCVIVQLCTAGIDQAVKQKLELLITQTERVTVPAPVEATVPDTALLSVPT